MKLIKSLFLSIILCFGFSSAAALPTFQDVSYVVISALRIGQGLCLTNRPVIDAQFAENYFKCYDVRSGEQKIYVKCQVDAFGSSLHNVAGLHSFCAKLLSRFPQYVMCLTEEFGLAGIIESSVYVQNCKEKVLGIGRYRQLIRSDGQDRII